MTVLTVLPVVLTEGTRFTSSIPNPGTSSGGGITFAARGLQPNDLADPNLSILLTVQMQYVAGGEFLSQPGAEFAWRGGSGQPLPSVSWKDPAYRRARCQVDVSRFVSVGIDAITP